MKKKSERLYDAITALPDETVEAAERHVAPRRAVWVHKRWLAGAVACLVLFGAAGAAVLGGMNRTSPSGNLPATGDIVTETLQSTDETKVIVTDPAGEQNAATDPGTNGYAGNIGSPGNSAQGGITGSISTLARCITAAKYPSYVAHPAYDPYSGDYELYKQYYNERDAWISNIRAQNDAFPGATEGLKRFLSNSIPLFAADNGGENVVLSPMSIYLTLGMLAESAEGESREQVLRAVGATSIEELREMCGGAWRALYRNDELTAALLNNSLWLSDSYTYSGDVTEALAEHYFASSFTGEMGSSDMNRMYRTWIKENTGGLLEEYAKDASFSEDTVMGLLNTVYFKARWSFDRNITEEGTFHTPSGDVTAAFMKKDLTGYFYGDNFYGVQLSFDSGSGYYMLVVLPHEGCSAESLLSDSQLMSLILSGCAGGNKIDSALVHLSLPKFDMSSKTDLISGLKALGISDVFDKSRASFSIADGASPLYINKVESGARLKIDDDGCEGAAYSAGDVIGWGPTPKELELTIDRPFVVAVVNSSFTSNAEDSKSLPLFLGVVNDPTA